MTFTADQIAAICGGKVEGNGATTVSGFGKIEEAKEGQIAFLANPKYEEYLYNTGASIVIINESLALKTPVGASLIRVPDAYSAFATLLKTYEQLQSRQLTGRQEPVYVEASATLGENLFIGAFVYIGKNVRIANHVKLHPQVYIGDNVTIGEGTVLHPGVKVYQDCVIGAKVTIHAGTVIGADGFGFAPQADGSYSKVPQMGNVVIEDHVEIGANSTIDRATIGSTTIRYGTKIDNLVQIAHNVSIGEHTVIAAQVGISGSTKIGKFVMIGGQAGFAGHIEVGDYVKINGQSGVMKSVKKGRFTGTPATEFTTTLRSQAIYKQLPELDKRVKELEIQQAKLNK